VGIQFGRLLGGAIVIEAVFAWPGIGNLAVQSLQSRDYPMVQGVVLLVSIMFIASNLMVDLLYGVIDPRVRYE
jgi:glutathione transport system permease protein